MPKRSRGVDAPQTDLARERALAQLAAAIALGVPPVAYQAIIDRARGSGATENEILGTLFAVAPIVGTTRTAAAAPHVALAIGYDVEVAFESPE